MEQVIYVWAKFNQQLGGNAILRVKEDSPIAFLFSENGIKAYKLYMQNA